MDIEQAKREIVLQGQPLTRAGAIEAVRMIRETAQQDPARLGPGWRKDLMMRAQAIRDIAHHLPEAVE